MSKRVGKHTIELENKPVITSYAAVAGKKEGQGPLARHFDAIYEDTTMGEKSWEKAESVFQQEAFTRALDKSKVLPADVDVVFAGDLLNQGIATTFSFRKFNIPVAGQFGACSTMAQALAMAAVFTDSGAANICAAVTSSHFCSAERQFRFPLEHGGQRPPSAQWTATAAGAAIVQQKGNGTHIRNITLGCITDLGINDANNMGAAMAPAAANTMIDFFNDTQTKPDDYDLIVTGDLGSVGSELFIQLMERKGYKPGSNYTDCGLLLFDRETQKVNAGASGCGCSASVLCSYLLNKLKQGEIKNLLFTATGALMSPTSSQQGESIPGIAHLVHLEN